MVTGQIAVDRRPYTVRQPLRLPNVTVWIFPLLYGTDDECFIGWGGRMRLLCTT
jgi:hypothetical protein